MCQRRVTVAVMTLSTLAASIPEHVIAQSVRDSAGIRVIESREARYGPTAAFWRLSAAPQLQIGFVDGDVPYLFTQIVGLFAFPDGAIAVADGGSDEIRVFDASGAHKTTAGRHGSGPGEFQDLRGIWLKPPDTLVAFDNARQLVQLFTSGGTHVRDFPVRISLNYERFAYMGDYAHVLGVDASGSVVFETPYGVPRGGPDGPASLTTTLLRFSPLGTGPDTIVTLAVGLVETTEAHSPGTFASPLFSAIVTPSVVGNAIYGATPDRYEILRYDRTGRVRTIIRRSFEPRTVQPEHVRQEHERRLGHVPDGSMRQRVQAILDRTPVPERFPPIAALLADEAGNLWARAYDYPEADSETWAVFDPEGVWLGELQLPARFHPFQVTSDRILGVWRNDDDVPFVRVYQLVK